MSLTLIVTKRVQSSLIFKNPLASSLLDHVGKTINTDALPFLRGVALYAQGQDLNNVSKLIEAIEEGAVFDVREEY